MTEPTDRAMIAKLVAGTIVGIAGFAIVTFAASPLVGVGVFLCLWGDNLSRAHRRFTERSDD